MSPMLVQPMAAHVALAAVLYVALTIARAPTVWGIGRGRDGGNPFAQLEPRISANLSNQFEWPLFFHVACVLLLMQGRTGPLALGLAWLFVAGRALHSVVQVFIPDIRLRGMVFTVNFLAVLALWGVVLAG